MFGKKSFALVGTFFLLSTPAFIAAQGVVSQNPCPYSCATAGIPKNVCRDWREGNTCFVEDMRRDARVSRGPIVPQGSAPAIVDSESNLTSAPDTLASDRNTRDREECRLASRSAIGRPRVEITDVRRVGNMFDDRYEVRGSVEGTCLAEAGYFEEGRLEEKIPVETARDFKRFEFEVTTRGDERPEIRAYNINGESEVLRLDREDLREAASRYGETGLGLFGRDL